MYKTIDTVAFSADVIESPEGITMKYLATIFENLVDYDSVLSRVAEIFDTTELTKRRVSVKIHCKITSVI